MILPFLEADRSQIEVLKLVPLSFRALFFCYLPELKIFEWQWMNCF